MVSARFNRIQALLVALLYLFFSTFGAVAHTHGAVDWETGAAGTHLTRAGAGPQSAYAARTLHSPAQHCAVCDWQAQNVMPLQVPQPGCSGLLARLVPSLRSFSFYSICLARFASRAPPAA